MKIPQLSSVLRDMQKEVIGLYFNQYTQTLEPVITDEDGYLTIITVGKLLGLQVEHREGYVFKFPDNKSLAEIMETPVEFQEWYNKTLNRCKS